MKIGQIIQFSAPQMGLWDLCVSGSNLFKSREVQFGLGLRQIVWARTQYEMRNGLDCGVGNRYFPEIAVTLRCRRKTSSDT